MHGSRLGTRTSTASGTPSSPPALNGFSQRRSRGPPGPGPSWTGSSSELRSGDVVVVDKVSTASPEALKDLLEIVDLIQARGAGFRSLGEDIDTTSPAGKLVFHVFASIAQFERERIVERTKEGLEAARKRGRVGGRPPALSPAQKAEVRRMRDEEHRPIPEIAALFKVSAKTIRRTT